MVPRLKREHEPFCGCQLNCDCSLSSCVWGSPHATCDLFFLLFAGGGSGRGDSRAETVSAVEDSLVVFVRKWHCTPARMNKCQAQALRALKNNLLSVIRVLGEGLKTAHESR